MANPRVRHVCKRIYAPASACASARASASLASCSLLRRYTSSSSADPRSVSNCMHACMHAHMHAWWHAGWHGAAESLVCNMHRH
eukprot:352942-Chlamydomonas_euryale.AAC.3